MHCSLDKLFRVLCWVKGDVCEILDLTNYSEQSKGQRANAWCFEQVEIFMGQISQPDRLEPKWK